MGEGNDRDGRCTSCFWCRSDEPGSSFVKKSREKREYGPLGLVGRTDEPSELEERDRSDSGGQAIPGLIGRLRFWPVSLDYSMLFCAAAATLMKAEITLPATYADQSIPARYRGKKVLNVPKGFKEKVIALTFDDGPEPKVTPKVLAALEKYDAKATFFVLGNYASRHKEIVRLTAEQGHVVGSHTWSHPAKPTQRRAGPEIWKTARTIYAATGQWPSVFRPPYGLDKAYTAQLARREGYSSIIWNKSGADTARHANADTVYINATKWARPGDVVLFHDGPGKAFTAAALPRVLKTLQKNGYQFITVPDMLRRWDAFLIEKEKLQQMAAAKVKTKLPATAQLRAKPKS